MSREEKVLKYQHPGVIGKLQTEMRMSKEEAERLFQDTLRFLWLCGSQPGKFSPSRRIDETWHRFILFTRDYHEFCNRFFGKYIHHGPLQEGRKREDLIRGAGLYTVAQKAFGASLHRENWLGESATSGTCCADCETEHESSCNCETCEHTRYLQTPEGKAKQARNEAEAKKERARRKPLDDAENVLDIAKTSLRRKETETRDLQTEIRGVGADLKSLIARLKSLEKTAKQTHEKLPMLRQAVQRATKKVKLEKQKYLVAKKEGGIMCRKRSAP